MNENIDLTKILKDCPKGTKLYSTIFGEVKFVKCTGLHMIIVKKKDKYYHFTQKGVFIFKGILCKGECTLFPSKDQRDWNKFTAPQYKKEKFDPKTLQPFDKVIVKIFNLKWKIDLFAYYDDDIPFPCMCSCYSYKYCIPYNDETKHLVGTTEEAPEYYRYWED